MLRSIFNLSVWAWTGVASICLSYSCILSFGFCPVVPPNLLKNETFHKSPEILNWDMGMGVQVHGTKVTLRSLNKSRVAFAHALAKFGQTTSFSGPLCSMTYTKGSCPESVLLEHFTVDCQTWSVAGWAKMALSTDEQPHQQCQPIHLHNECISQQVGCFRCPVSSVEAIISSRPVILESKITLVNNADAEPWNWPRESLVHPSQ